MSINLHAAVRGAISGLHPDEALLLYQSKGHQNIRGEVIPVFEAPIQVTGQIQSEQNDTLEPSREANAVTRTRKCYLYAGAETGYIPSTLIRALAKGGDFIQRDDGTFWLIVAMLEDFSTSGWVCVRIEQQLKMPENAIIEEVEDPEDPEDGEEENGDTAGNGSIEGSGDSVL